MAAPPAGPIPEGKTFGLFVCAGKHIKKDVWMFADFQATAKTFMATGGMTGTYINLYDYETFLEDLPKDKDVPQRIAWGYQGANTGEPLIEFRASDPTFWQQIPKRDHASAPDLVVNEIKRIAKEAKFPDKVNLFFFCEGDGFLSLGGYQLSYKRLNEIIAEDFNFGVQVNIIVAACYSSLLVDKIKTTNMERRTVQTSANAMQKSWSYRTKGPSGQWRGSPFIVAFASSLQQGLEDARAGRPNRTVKEHFDCVNSLGGLDNPAKLDVGLPQAWQGNGPEGAMDAVLNVLLRSYHVRTRTGGEIPEVAFTPSKPRPQLAPQDRAAASASYPDANDKYIRGIQHELDRLQDPENPSHDNDKGFFTCIHYLRMLKNSEELVKQWGLFLGAMRWRFRVQEFFFLVFHDLLRDEMIDEKALQTPMDIEKHNPDVDSVVELLSCFEIGAVCSWRADTFGELVNELGHGHFEMPLRWLAILILRSHPETELSAISKYLLNSRNLGKLREDFLKECDPITVQRISNVCKAETKDQQKAYELAFILPTHGKLKLWAEETLLRYEHYQGMFDDLYGKNAWGGGKKFKELLEMYKTTDLSDILGPRVRQHQTYLDNLSPLPPISGSSTAAPTVFSEGTTASSAPTEHSSGAVQALESPLANLVLGMEEEEQED